MITKEDYQHIGEALIEAVALGYEIEMERDFSGYLVTLIKGRKFYTQRVPEDHLYKLKDFISYMKDKLK